ncbi:MAG: T9SS type A sorting domain-containing protein, partial [Bacteroidota bacterium]
GVSGGLTWNGNVAFTTQAQVDAFPACYSIIDGNMTVQNAGVVSLANLVNLVEVTGNVMIKQTGLSNMTGLNNLATIGGYLKIFSHNSSGQLVSLNGLDGVMTVGGVLQVFSNLELVNCCAVEDLVNEINGHSVGGAITIVNNPNGCSSVANINATCVNYGGGGSNNLLLPDEMEVEAEMAGLSHEQVFSSLTLFPNPISASGGRRLMAIVSGDFERGNLRVFDAMGRMVHFQKLEAGASELQIEMETGGWKAGIYLVQVMLDGAVLTQKLMVE